MDQELNKKPKVALVIGSGGLKCAAALGIFDYLEKENIGIDLVVGCSGGAIMGGFIVTGRSSEETIHLVNTMWERRIVLQFRLRKILKMIFPKLLGFDESFGLTDDTLMVRQYEKAYGVNTTFADTVIPFRCVATDIKTGEPVVIADGRVADAVRISSGIQLLFEAVEYKGKLLVDGGISNPLPVDVAIKEGADVIVAVGFQTPKLPDVTSPGRFISQMFTVLSNELLSLKMAFYGLAHHSEIVIIIPEFEEDYKLTDTHKIPEIIALGAKETEKHIGYIRQLMDTGFGNK
jgi:NTE family protein